jgi:hypothetical protein
MHENSRLLFEKYAKHLFQPGMRVWVYHEAPIDCWRMFPEAMRALYEEAGLIVELREWGSLETPQRASANASYRVNGVRQALRGIDSKHHFTAHCRVWIIFPM